MRMLWLYAAAALLLAALQILARLASAHYPQSARVATGVFVVMWFLVTAINMWIGVTKAGYSVAEEVPIHGLILGVPVAVALFLQWKVL